MNVDAGAPPTLLSDLRARRLARRVIEAQERLDAGEHGLACFGDGEREALCFDRDCTVARLERAAARLPGSMLLRACIDETCRAHRACKSAVPGSDAERESVAAFAAALAALHDALRCRSDAPAPASSRSQRHDVCTDASERRS